MSGGTEEPVKTSFAIVKNPAGQVALIQEGGRQAHGMWCLPGGHVDEGESPQDAAIREAREEAGLEIVITGEPFTMTIDGFTYLGNPAENKKQIELTIFYGVVSSPTIVRGEEELDARWFTKEEVETVPLRWNFLKDLLVSIL